MSEANKMFEKLGYEKQEIYYNSDIDTIKYLRTGKYSSSVEFKFNRKTVVVYFGENNTAGNITMDILQAINEKCKELGWIEE